MKTHTFALCLSFVVAGCASGMQEYWDLNATTKLADLGWIDYPESDWKEVDPNELETSKYVVQLGMNARIACAEDYSCYVAQPVTELAEGKRSLCPLALESAEASIPGQHSVGVFTGVLVDAGQGGPPLIVTAKHAEKYLNTEDEVMFDHHASNTDAWLDSDNETMMVHDSHIGKIKTKEIRRAPDIDLMGFELHDIERAGVSLAASVEDGTDVYALFHVFGLPMKSSNWAQTTNCDADGLYCEVMIDLAVGGSGGPLFTRDGKLAGILVGQGLEWTSKCEHGNKDRIHPCNNATNGCNSDRVLQKFVTAKAIRSIF